MDMGELLEDRGIAGGDKQIGEGSGEEWEWIGEGLVGAGERERRRESSMEEFIGAAAAQSPHAVCAGVWVG